MEHYISLLVSENFRFQAKIKAKFRVKRKSRILVLQNVRDLTFFRFFGIIFASFSASVLMLFSLLFLGGTLYTVHPYP